MAQVELWHPTAVDALARLVRATVTALRRQRVAELLGALAALRARLDALHDPDAHDRDAAAVLARMGERVGHALPVATIRWPTKGGPFDPPTLVEPD